MPADLTSMGETFKVRRNDMNLSLKEVENATSIRMNYLQAIEKGSIANVISHVYAKGFIQQYASFLNLDGDALLLQHGDAFGETLGRTAQDSTFIHNIDAVEVRGNPSNTVKWLPNAVLVGASMFLIVAAWYLAKYLGVL